MKKRGAIELSMSTIIVVILSLVLLSMGVFFVNKTMCAAIKGIDDFDKGWQGELEKIIGDQKKVAIKESLNEVHKGVSYGVGFGIRNSGDDSEKFSYELSVVEIEDKCGFAEDKAMSFVSLGEKESSISIKSGEEYFGLIKFDIPKEVNNCQVKYRIKVMNNNEEHGQGDFFVDIKPKAFTQSFC